MRSRDLSGGRCMRVLKNILPDRTSKGVSPEAKNRAGQLCGTGIKQAVVSEAEELL